MKIGIYALFIYHAYRNILLDTLVKYNEIIIIKEGNLMGNENFEDDELKNSSENETPEEIPKEKQEEYVKEGFFKKVKKVSAKVPFILDAVTMYYCSIDLKTPLWAKGACLAALAYFINPQDFIPDYLLPLGYTDDAAAISTALIALGKNVTDQHRDQASQIMLGKRFIDDNE
jgi:uncharacterized membrane protein YkvA (DUF1232 family)